MSGIEKARSTPTVGQSVAGMWLDLLPPEVCDNIALHLSCGMQSDSALHLGQTSQKMRNAISSAVGYTLDLASSSSSDCSSRAWSALLHNDMNNLEIGQPSMLYCRDFIAYLLSAPMLKRVAIIDDSHALACIAASTSIRELQILFTDCNRDYTTELNQGVKLMQALSAMHLQKLQLTCCTFKGKTSRCPFSNDDFMNPAHAGVPDCFTSLVALEIFCENGDHLFTDFDPLWRIFPAANALQDIKFHGDVPDAMFSRVQTMECIGIKSGQFAHSLALRIGPAVKELDMQSVSLNETQIAQLSQLPNLTMLNIAIIPGAENALSQLLPYLRSLIALYLHWDHPRTCIHDRDRHHYPCYYIPDSGAISAALNGGRFLEKLALMDVCLSVEELTGILSHIGVNLKVFWTSLADQTESQLERLENLLYVVGKQNCNLRQFGALDIDGRDGYISRTEAVEQKKRLQLALERLKRCAPLVDTSQLERQLAELG